MPELPEVEMVKRTLECKIENRKILKTDVSPVVQKAKLMGKECIIKKQSVDIFIKHTKHLVFQSLERRGKYLNFHVTKEGVDYVLVTHLGMTGAWFVVKDIHEIETSHQHHAHVVFTLDNGLKLVYGDIRRFGEMRWLTKEEYLHFRPLIKMAPEPFSSEALTHFITLVQQTKFQRMPIHQLLLNAQCICGVGNIYDCEALFLARIDPERLTNTLSENELTTIFHHIVSVLEKSIQAGGTSFSDYVNANGEKGDFQNQTNVYQRWKKPCVTCETPIQKVTINKRTAFYCPSCQK